MITLNYLYQLAIALMPLYPFLWAALIIVIKLVFNNLPAAQQAALEKNALSVVEAVEQVGAGMSSADKKARAVSMLEAVCAAGGIKFNPVLADVAIEATVFGFNQMKDAVVKNQPTPAPVADVSLHPTVAVPAVSVQA